MKHCKSADACLKTILRYYCRYIVCFKKPKFSCYLQTGPPAANSFFKPFLPAFFSPAVVHDYFHSVLHCFNSY